MSDAPYTLDSLTHTNLLSSFSLYKMLSFSSLLFLKHSSPYIYETWAMNRFTAINLFTAINTYTTINTKLFTVLVIKIHFARKVKYKPIFLTQQITRQVGMLSHVFWKTNSTS